MMRRVAAFIVRRRGWIAPAWLLLFLGLAPSAGTLEQELEVAAQIRGSEAAAVERRLESDFASPFASFAVLVAAGIPAPDRPEGARALERIRDAVAAVPGVSGTFSWLDVPDPLFLGAAAPAIASGSAADSVRFAGASRAAAPAPAPPAATANVPTGTFMVVGLDPEDGRLDAMVPLLRAATEPLREALNEAHPAVALRWTGESVINYDIRRTSATDSATAERRALPLTLVLLLLAFGAVVAALLPLLAGVIAIIVALGATVLVNAVLPLSILLQSIVTMIGLGLGIDYALLTVSRFREAMAAGRSPEEAATEAAHHAGTTIALSGASVMIGFAALVFVPLNELQSIGIGGIIVVGTAVLLAVTLLPGLLAWLGPRVDRGRLFRTRVAASPMEARWRAWGCLVVRRPVLVLVAAGIPVALLASEVRHIRAELPRGNWLPAAMESARALEDLAAMERTGVVNTIRVLLDLPEGVDALDPAGWAAIERLTAELAADERIQRVQSVAAAAGAAGVPVVAAREGAAVAPASSGAPLLAHLPDDLVASLLTADRRTALLEAMPREGVDFNDLTALSREIRAIDVAAATGLPGARLMVGGMPAFNADYIDAIDARLPRVLAMVVLATLVALMIGFRSILIPLKALALNLVSVAAAFGAVVLVFQKGYGAGLLGLDGPLGAVFPAVPILVFCIVFGLSMDYEVFLVARVREARRRMGEEDAIVEGLAKTGGVITSAAAIMIVVFGAFAFGDFLFIKVLGFALAVAVLVDATVVRVAIGPALLRLGGRWNWWPGDGMAARTRTLNAPRKD